MSSTPWTLLRILDTYHDGPVGAAAVDGRAEPLLRLLVDLTAQRVVQVACKNRVVIDLRLGRARYRMTTAAIRLARRGGMGRKALARYVRVRLS